MQLEKNIKLGFVMDDYKYKDKKIRESTIAQALSKTPWVLKHYKLVKEKASKGPIKGAVSVFRYYELKENA